MCDDARAEGRTQGFKRGESIGIQKQALYRKSDFDKSLPLDEIKRLQMK